MGSQAASNPDTVMFRHKDNDEFKRLHDWLVTVVEHNRSTGVDFSVVEFDAAKQTRMERIQARADESAAAAERKKYELQQVREDQQEHKQQPGEANQQQQPREDKPQQSREEKQTDKMSRMLGDQRPDIVAAAARMGHRMGGKRELKNLASHLLEGETVRFIAQGTYEDHQGILVLTDVRLLFLFHGIVGQAKEDFPLRLISSVQTKSGFATGELKVFVSGNHSIISTILKSDLEPLANAVRQGMAARQVAAAQAQAAPPAATDPFEALQKLASLRDAGILSPEEFEAKKQELLKRCDAGASRVALGWPRQCRPTRTSAGLGAVPHRVGQLAGQCRRRLPTAILLSRRLIDPHPNASTRQKAR